MTVLTAFFYTGLDKSSVSVYLDMSLQSTRLETVCFIVVMFAAKSFRGAVRGPRMILQNKTFFIDRGITAAVCPNSMTTD